MYNSFSDQLTGHLGAFALAFGRESTSAESGQLSTPAALVSNDFITNDLLAESL
jgi:hypothetical protein